MSRGVVVLVVLLAGCSGALGGGTPSPSVTPAPVPSATATPTPDAPVPGVSGGRLAEPGALVTAHRIALASVGYTRVRTERATMGNRTRWTLTTRTRVAADGRTHAVIVPEGPERPPTILPGTTRIERYRGEGATWVAVWNDGERRVTRYPEGFAVGREQLFPVFGSVRVRVAERRATGSGVSYRLVGEGVRDPDLLQTATRRENAVGPRLVATVTGDGVVRSYRYSYAVAAPPATDTRREYVHSYRVTAVGETTVSRPSWVPANASAG